MDPAVKGFLNLGIDVSLADQATKGSLNMGAGAAETVVEIEVAESRIQVVAPKEANHAPAKPDTFGIAGRAGQNTGGLGYFVDLLLGLFGSVSGRFLRLGWLSVAAAALRESRRGEPKSRHARQYG